MARGPWEIHMMARGLRVYKKWQEAIKGCNLYLVARGHRGIQPVARLPGDIRLVAIDLGGYNWWPADLRDINNGQKSLKYTFSYQEPLWDTTGGYIGLWKYN